MQVDAGLRKEVGQLAGGFSERLETAGEEMQGILSGTDDGRVLPGLLQTDAGHQSGEAAADNYGIKSHRPRTFL